MPDNVVPLARSRYRQVRLTFQQEVSGRINYSVHAKGLNDPWTAQTCLIRDSLPDQPHILCTDDVYAAVERLMVHLRWDPEAPPF